MLMPIPSKKQSWQVTMASSGKCTYENKTKHICTDEKGVWEDTRVCEMMHANVQCVRRSLIYILLYLYHI